MMPDPNVRRVVGFTGTRRGMTPAQRSTVRGLKGPLERNRDIVADAHYLIAAPLGVHTGDTRDGPLGFERSGTWATIRYAHARGLDVWAVTPDGADWWLPPDGTQPVPGFRDGTDPRVRDLPSL